MIVQDSHRPGALQQSGYQISCIIPAYNVESYVAEALSSALRQNPSFHEIILVDDGSKDNTKQIVQAFKDPRIKYYYQENSGLGPARNAGLALAEGEYVFFFDGDDVLSHDMTKQIDQILRSYSTRLDAIFFSAIDFDNENRNVLSSSRYFERKSTGLFHCGLEALTKSLLSNSFPASAWLYVFRKKILSQNGLKFLNEIHEDAIFTPQIFIAAGPVFITDSVLYQHRVRQGSIMTSAITERNVRGMLLAAQVWLKIMKSEELPERKILNRQAHLYYCQAIRAAGHARLDLQKTWELVVEIAPEFAKYAKFDSVIAKFSKRLALEYGVLRSKFSEIEVNDIKKGEPL